MTEKNSTPHQRVLQDIMTDLVAGDRAHLVERGVLEGDVGDRDARRASDAAGIGGEIVRLARAVVHVDLVRRDARRAAPSRPPRRAPVPAAPARYLLNKGSIRIGDSSRTKARTTAVSAPDHSHQRLPVRRISQ